MKRTPNASGPELVGSIIPRVPNRYSEHFENEESERLEWLLGVYERWIAASTDPDILRVLEDAHDAIRHELASREPLPDGVVV